MGNLAFLFPGQGEQYPKMGKDFYDAFEIAREILQRAEESLSKDICGIMFSSSLEELTKTINCQIALYIHSSAILNVVRQQYPSFIPTVSSGLSVGEYAALYSCNAFSFEEGLVLLNKRAKYLNEACESNKGTMAAVLGLDGEKVKQVVQSLNADVWVANYNSPIQTVISGTIEGVELASKELLQNGARKITPLQVAGAFHSPLMISAEEKLKKEIFDGTKFDEKTSKIVMNATGDYVDTTEEIKNNLVKQVTGSVYWEKGIRAIDNREGDITFVEIGCGRVLSGLNKRIGVQKKTLSIGKVDQLDDLIEQLEGLKCSS